MESVSFRVEMDTDGSMTAVSTDERLCAHAADLAELREKLDRLVSAVFGTSTVVVAVTHGAATVGLGPRGRRAPLPARRVQPPSET